MRSGTRFFFTLLFLFFSLWVVLRFLLPFVLPFLLGLLLALAAEPLVRFLCNRLRLPRALGAGIGVSCAFLLLSALVLGFFALLFRELRVLSSILPDLRAAVTSGIDVLEQWLLSLSQKMPKSIQPMLKQHVLDLFSDSTAFLEKAVSYILGLAGGMLTHIPDQAFTLLTGIISGFMISAKLPFLKKWFARKLSKERIRSLLSFLRQVRCVVGHWALAQVKLAGVTFLILTAGLILLKTPYAPLWAFFIALLDALPLLGTGAVLIPWSLISLLQENTAKAIGLIGIYIVASLSRSVLEPRFVGKQLGLDPLVTLAALYGGYKLWGFGGMILSPLLAVTAFQLIPKAADSGKTG